MKLKSLLLIIIISLNTALLHSQKKEVNRVVYMKIKDFKKKNKKITLSKSDSLNIVYIHNDTLIKIENYQQPKGVSVAYEYKDEAFLKQYKKIAFNHKEGRLSYKTTMKYWKKPIKIFFSKSIKKSTKKKFLKFTSLLSKKTDSLHISEVKKIEDSNYIIYFKGDFEYESRMQNKEHTDYYMYWNRKNQIYKCALRINSENNFNESLRLYAMKDYFFRTLGYFKLSNEFKCESYFSDCYSKNKYITDFDLALLQYHYSYGICKGTDLKTFEEQHKRSKENYTKKNHQMHFIHQN